MSVHISDSAIYRNSWATPEQRALFDDAALTAGWIEVMVVLAETEAEFGLVPAAAASQIATACQAVALDDVFFTEVREDFERTNHSLLGLIRALQRRCAGDSGEWLCYGATVQDITDTHTARILVKVRNIFADQLTSVATVLFDLARRYRNTPMCGRTHGQPGLPITFGFKAAGWLDEAQRHRQRLDEVGARIGVGQLAGGVGSLSAFGAEALAVQLGPDELAAVAETVLGKVVEISPAALQDALDPEAAVAARTAPGGAAPEAMEAMIVECERALADADAWTSNCGRRLQMAKDSLLRAVREYSRRPAASNPPSV